MGKSNHFNYQYENIYISSFIYSFGYIAGKKNFDSPAAFSLYQQTPKDKPLCDLFASLGGKNLILEFKREYKLVETELAKPQRVDLLNQINNNPELKELSDRIHFLGFPHEDEMLLMNYSSLNLQKQNRKAIRLIDFINHVIEREGLGVNYVELSKYMKVLNKCYTDADSSTSSGGKNKLNAEQEITNSGLVFNFSQEGELTFYSFHNELEMVYMMDLALSRDLSRKIEIEQILDRGYKKSHNHGHSL